MPRLALVLYKYFPFGGLQRDFMGVAMAAVASGFSVDVYTMRWEGARPDGLNIIIIPPRGLTNHRRYYYFIKQFQRYRAQQDYQAVIGFNKMPGLDFYYAGDPCVAAKYRLWQRFLPRYHWFAKCEASVFAKDKPTIILSLSELQMQRFQQSYLTQSQRFHLLPPWVKVKNFLQLDRDVCRRRFADELDLPMQAKWLLHVGSGFRTKGLDRSIKTLAALSKDQDTPLCLLVVGKDNIRPFKQLAKKLGVSAQVYFIGGRYDIAEWMCAADLLLHPAYEENTGNVLLEAMAAGLPVITTAVCGYAHHIELAQAGIVIAEPFRQQQLTQHVKTWLCHGINTSRVKDYLATLELESMPNHVISLLTQYMLRNNINS